MDQQLLLTYILAFSIIIQLTAAILAFRLIGITGRRMAWIFIAMALTPMAVRRIIPLYHLMADSLSFEPDSFNELIGLVLSLMMVVGIARIGPIFIERKRSADEVERLNAELEQRVIERTAHLEASN